MLHAGRNSYGFLRHRIKLFEQSCTTSWSFILPSLPNPIVICKNEHRLHNRTFISPAHAPAAKSIAAQMVNKFPRRMQAYLRLSRLDKPTGALLAIWPGLWSVGMAANGGYCDMSTLLYTGLVFTAGGFLVRSAGCIMNDMWDRDFDRRVARTRSRPLASGEIKFFPSLVYLGANLSLALMVLLEFNLYTIVVGACCIPLVALYPLAKRFTHWPQAVLGLAFNWGALMGYCAVHGSNFWPVVLPLYIGCACWSLFYDTIYAYQDVQDDKQVGVKSTALKFGQKPEKWLLGFAAAATTSWICAGLAAQMPFSYYAMLGVAAAHMGYQVLELKVDDPQLCWQIFKSNQHIGPIVMAGILCGNFF